MPKVCDCSRSRFSSVGRAKTSASVGPEVDLRECTLHSPPQKANKAEPTLALTPRGNITRNPKQGYQWPPKKDMCVRQKLLKKKKKVCDVSLNSICQVLTDDKFYLTNETGKVCFSMYLAPHIIKPQMINSLQHVPK